MSNPMPTKLPPLVIAEAKLVSAPSHQYELSLKDVPSDGANVSIKPTDIGTSKDRLQIYINGKVVVDEEFNNNPPQTIHARIPRSELLKQQKQLEHLGISKIHYMIRIGQGNGEMGESQTYLITH